MAKKKRTKAKPKAAHLPPARLKNKSEGRKFKTILAIILSIGIFTYGIYAVYFSDFFLIQDFTVEEEGTIIEDASNINTIVERLIGKNLVLINEADLITKIREQHPEIETIRIKKIFPSSIKIEYEKYPTVANLINIVDNVQKKFLIDNQGFLVEENIEHPGLPYIHYSTSTFLQVRSNFLNDDTRSRQRLQQITNALKLFEEKFAIKILYAEYRKQEREIHLHTEKNFFVMIDAEKDLNRQIEKLKKALPKLDIYNEPLVYIDVRISGTDTEKIIYKRR